MFQKRTFTIMVGICVLGIIILEFYTTFISFTTIVTYGNFQNLKYCKIMEIRHSGLPTSSDISRRQHLDLQQVRNVKWKEHFSIPEIKFPVKSQSNNSTDQSPEVHPRTTSMTFNQTLVVHCKESPYIECVPHVVTVTNTDMFKISFLRRPFWHPKELLNTSSCPYNQCQVSDSTVTNETDLVLVYGVGLRETVKLPQRWGHQLYAISVWEPPGYSRSLYVKDANFVWNHQFNLTITYRVDSDIFSPYSRLSFKPKPLEQRPNYYEISQNKTRTVVWMVSHCWTQSKRHLYVAEMQKYVDVDIFGKCGQPCRKSSSFCDNLPSKYKFYLSFENSLCTDYVTEKFFKLFAPGMHVIPVVRGGADYDKYFPEFTYINAAHFKTPKDLALYLKNLASDHETYSKYLEHKDLYENSRSGFDLICRVCEYLHTHKTVKRKNYDLKEWIVDGQCHKATDV